MLSKATLLPKGVQDVDVQIDCIPVPVADECIRLVGVETSEQAHRLTCVDIGGQEADIAIMAETRVVADLSDDVRDVAQRFGHENDRTIVRGTR